MAEKKKGIIVDMTLWTDDMAFTALDNIVLGLPDDEPFVRNENDEIVPAVNSWKGTTYTENGVKYIVALNNPGTMIEIDEGSRYIRLDITEKQYRELCA